MQQCLYEMSVSDCQVLTTYRCKAQHQAADQCGCLHYSNLDQYKLQITSNLQEWSTLRLVTSFLTSYSVTMLVSDSYLYQDDFAPLYGCMQEKLRKSITKICTYNNIIYATNRIHNIIKRRKTYGIILLAVAIYKIAY